MRELFRWQTTTIAIVGVHFDGDSSKLPSGSGLLERKNAICDILLTVILVISAGTKCEWRLIRLMTAADALLRRRDRFLRPDRLDDVARTEPLADPGSGAKAAHHARLGARSHLPKGYRRDRHRHRKGSTTMQYYNEVRTHLKLSCLVTIASTTEYPLLGASLWDVSLSSAILVFVAM